MSSPNVAIVIFPDPRQLVALAKAALSGIVEAGGNAEIFQVKTTAEDGIVERLNYPVLCPNNLKKFDAFLFGFPSYFGSYPADFKAFWDGTGDLWASNALSGKSAGVFVTTGVLGGGQEACFVNSLSVLVHHGIIYVPLGYHDVMKELEDLSEVHGGSLRRVFAEGDDRALCWRLGSPWGAGALAGTDGTREVSRLELEIAKK